MDESIDEWISAWAGAGSLSFGFGLLLVNVYASGQVTPFIYPAALGFHFVEP